VNDRDCNAPVPPVLGEHCSGRSRFIERVFVFVLESPFCASD
jgi:hypothetical protein